MNFILFLFFIIGSIVGLIYLSFLIPKKLGYEKLGKLLSRSLILVILFFISSFVFEDYLFFKSDVKKHLSTEGFTIKDDFKITYKKYSDLIDYYHRFEIEISTSD